MNHDEDDIQAAAIAQYQVRGTSSSVLFAIPNGEKRDKATAGRLKAAGVTAGAPDLFAGAHGIGLFIEVKTAKGKRSGPQKDMHRRIEAAAGMKVVTAYGLDDLISVLEDHGVLRSNRAFIGAA